MGQGSSRQRVSDLTFQRFYKEEAEGRGSYRSVSFMIQSDDFSRVKYTEQAWDGETTEAALTLREHDSIEVWNLLSGDCLTLLRQLSETRTGMSLDPKRAVYDIDTVRAIVDGIHHEVSYVIRAIPIEPPPSGLSCTQNRSTSNPGGSPYPLQRVMGEILGIIQQAYATGIAAQEILRKLKELEKKTTEYGALPCEQISDLHSLRATTIRWIEENDGAVSPQELSQNWARVITAYAAADAAMVNKKQDRFAGQGWG